MFMEYIRMINECETKASQSSRYYSEKRSELDLLDNFFENKLGHEGWAWGISESAQGDMYMELSKLED